MSGDSQFGHCSNFTDEELSSLNLAWSISGSLCGVIAIAITMLLLFSKSYQSLLQRLVLYLNISTVLSELFLVASVEHQFRYPGQDQVCAGIAFIFNWMVILRVILSIGVMIHMFFLVWQVAKGNTASQSLQSNRCRSVSLEIVFLLLSTILTFVYSAVPLITRNYGLAGAWCWISAVGKDCKTVLSGFLSQIFYGYLIFVSNGIIGTILTIAVAIVYCKLSPTLQGESKSLLKKTLFVMLFFFLYSLTQILGFINRILAAKISQYQFLIVWFVVGTLHPISLLLFPMSFIFSFYPVSKLWRSTPCGKALKCCQCRRKRAGPHVHFQEQPHIVQFQKKAPASVPSYTHFEVPYTNQFTNITAENEPLVVNEGSTTGPTFQSSTRVSQPSSTFFNVPYTNEFTHVTSENEPIVIQKRSSTGNASLTDPDTGYGSISQQGKDCNGH